MWLFWRLGRLVTKFLCVYSKKLHFDFKMRNRIHLCFSLDGIQPTQWFPRLIFVSENPLMCFVAPGKTTFGRQSWVLVRCLSQLACTPVTKRQRPSRQPPPPLMAAAPKVQHQRQIVRGTAMPTVFHRPLQRLPPWITECQSGIHVWYWIWVGIDFTYI